jgi:ABC-2 type transport system ATP-binding protein
MTVPADTLAQLRERHQVSKMVRTPEGVRVRLLSPVPPRTDAVLVTPDLEDAYLTIIHGSRRPTRDDATEARG